MQKKNRHTSFIFFYSYIYYDLAVFGNLTEPLRKFNPNPMS